MSKFKEQYTKEDDVSFGDLTLHNIGHEACDPLHTWTGVREFYSIHTIVEGKGIYKVGEEVFSLKAGDTFLVYPDTLVTYIADETQPWEYLWMGVSGFSVKNILDYTLFTADHPCIYKEEQSQEPNQLKDYLLNIYKIQGSDSSSELERIGLTYVFLSKLMSQHKGSQLGQGQHYAQKAKEFIELNYSSGISPQQVADKLNISRSHLHRVFTQAFDASTGKYINKLRMDRAVLLLLTTPLSIHEISNSVGFENQLYFSNVFKKNFGLSPSDYRKTKRK